MKLSADLKAFQTRLGHEFSQPALLVRAVTHSSMVSANRDDNQRLEFLGDRVLGLVISEALLSEDTNATEGQLAPRFNALVRKETCADVARQIDLGVVIKMGRSEMISGGRRKQAILGDAMEAVIAAVYLDAGYDRAREVTLSIWGQRIHTVKTDARDSKTSLQEWAQAFGWPPPVYEVISQTGPDHDPQFMVKVTIENGANATATEGSKRKAQQAAAHILHHQCMDDYVREKKKGKRE